MLAYASCWLITDTTTKTTTTPRFLEILLGCMRHEIPSQGQKYDTSSWLPSRYVLIDFKLHFWMRYCASRVPYTDSQLIHILVQALEVMVYARVSDHCMPDARYRSRRSGRHSLVVWTHPPTSVRWSCRRCFLFSFCCTGGAGV